MVDVSASANLPLHHKVQKLASGTCSPVWSRKKGRKTVVVVFLSHPDMVAMYVCILSISPALTLNLCALQKRAVDAVCLRALLDRWKMDS